MNAISPKKKPSLSVVGQPGTFNAIQKVCAILRVLAQNSPLRLTEIAEATSPRITPKYLRERIVAARKHGHTVQVDVALPGMGGVGVPVRDDAGQVIAALSVGASSDRIRRREAELAEMLKREALILARAMAQPAKPGALKMIKAS